MPARPEDQGIGPEWVSWVGCIHPGYNRSCDDCGHTWDGPGDVEGEE